MFSYNNEKLKIARIAIIFMAKPAPAKGSAGGDREDNVFSSGTIGLPAGARTFPFCRSLAAIVLLAVLPLDRDETRYRPHSGG